MYIVTPPLGMKEGIPAALSLSWCLVYLRARPSGAGMWGSLLHSEEGQAGSIVKIDSETGQSRNWSLPCSLALCSPPRRHSLVPPRQPGQAPVTVRELSAASRTLGDI